MNKAQAFKQKDVTRAIKGVRDAGADVSLVEVTQDGTIRVFTQPPKENLAPVEDFEL
jgi:hypothetical protein